jgi:hypothetical protein
VTHKKSPDDEFLEGLAGDFGRAVGEGSPLSAHARRLLLDPQRGVARTLRLPLALVVKDVAHGESPEVIVQPITLCRPLALVVDPTTAKSFDLVSLTLGNSRMTLSEEPWPLDTFSIEFMVDDKIASVNALAGWPSAETFTRLSCKVRRREGSGANVATFRGLLWCEASWR